MVKQFSLVVGLLVFLSLSHLSLADGFLYGVVQDADGWTNVRKSATLDSEIIDRVYSDDRVIVTGEQGEFYDCMMLFQSGELPETFGFIHQSRVQGLRPALGAGIVNDPDGWSFLRSGPDTSSKALRKLYPGQGFFVVLGKSGEWYKIETREGTVGFLHGSRLEWVIPRN